MAITIGGWIFLIVIAFLGLILSVAGGFAEDNFLLAVVGILITIIICIGAGAFMSWYNTSTASGIRNYKDYQSEMSNGIEREITITAEDGREIFHYEGKVDIESNHSDNYIKFESEEGKRYIIYYGIQDTILIVEK